MRSPRPIEEFDAPGIEHVEILRRVARAIEHGARGVVFTPRELRQLFDRPRGDPVEELADVQRSGFAAKIERVAFARERIALQRGFGQPQRFTGADIPLPQMHVAGKRRAVEQALAQRYVLVRALRLEAEELAARVRHHELEPALGLAFLETVLGDIGHAADHALRHQLNLS